MKHADMKKCLAFMLQITDFHIPRIDVFKGDNPFLNCK